MCGKGYELGPQNHKVSLAGWFWNRLYSKTGYLYSTRTTAYGLILLLPLLAAYEYLAVRLNEESRYQVRNLADVLLKEVISAFGIHGLKVFGIVLAIAILLAFFLRKRQSAPLRIPYYFLAILESAFYAALLGLVVSKTISLLFASLSLSQDKQIFIMLSLGAGVYEELIFRVLLFKFTAITLVKFTGSPKLAAYLFAALFSSVLFSYSHFLGAEAPAFYPFVYRLIMGLYFCVIFWARGLGVVAWTHTLYDLFILFNGN